MKIKKTLLRKSIIATLLLVLAFSATATNIRLVQADEGGTGKFLTIAIEDGGYVKATKVESGETWYFYPADPPMTEKVGAGTVELEAFASDGWEFSCWGEDLTGAENPTDYKTEKYGYVVAVFEELTHTITAIAIGPGTINGEPELTVEVEHGGASPTFEFAPTDPALYHITSIKVDNNYTSYTTSYAFPDPITSDHNIVVTFDDIGTAAVHAGIGVESFVDSIASLILDDTDGGTVIGISLDFPEGTSLYLYDITTDATDADGLILLAFQLNGLTPVAVYKGDSADALYSDVDKDGDVDGTDVSLIANAIKSTTPGGEYLADYDVDRNGVLDEDDIHTVNENKGATLTELDFWIEGNTLYILNLNNDWSCFRIH